MRIRRVVIMSRRIRDGTAQFDNSSVYCGRILRGPPAFQEDLDLFVAAYPAAIGPTAGGSAGYRSGPTTDSMAASRSGGRHQRAWTGQPSSTARKAWSSTASRATGRGWPAHSSTEKPADKQPPGPVMRRLAASAAAGGPAAWRMFVSEPRRRCRPSLAHRAWRRRGPAPPACRGAGSADSGRGRRSFDVGSIRAGSGSGGRAAPPCPASPRRPAPSVCTTGPKAVQVHLLQVAGGNQGVDQRDDFRSASSAPAVRTC